MEESDKMDISPPTKEIRPAARKTKKNKKEKRDKSKAKAKRKTKKAKMVEVDELKKQRKKRAEVVAKKRDPCKALEKYGYVVSHGELHKRVIEIPANIRLIQYATPGTGMYGADVYGIIHQLVEVRKGTDEKDTIRLRKNVKRLNPPPILVSKLDGKIYLPDGNDLLVTEPGEETTDMGLDFDMSYNHVSPLFGMHISMPNGQVVWPSTKSASMGASKHITLGALLADVSQEYANKCPNHVLNLVQVSCKLNAWEQVESVVDNKPVIEYKRGNKPTILDVGNLAQMMKRGMRITSSLEKEVEKDVKVGATPEPIESVYGKTREILDDYIDRGAKWDASFVPWLNTNFHRVYDLASAKKWYRDIRKKKPVVDKAAESYDISESFVFK
jgi:hypothetical protein